MEKANVLICEDERLTARDIEASLMRNGYTIAGIASDGESALRIAEECSPDLALMDIRLKGRMNGIEVAGILQDSFQIPSIMLTAYADDETLQQVKSIKPLSYLIKPFDELELKAAVEVGLSRFREQRKAIDALNKYVTELAESDPVEKAVELERQFMLSEQINSYLRVAGNIGERLENEIALAEELLESLSNDSSVDQEKRSMLKGALIHQDHALEILRQLKLCGDNNPARVIETTLQEVLAESVREMKRVVGGEISIIDSTTAHEPLRVAIDKERVKGALLNVLLNACEAMPGMPVITLSTGLLYEELPQRFNAAAQIGWYAVLKVGDLGKGIDKSAIQHVFEPCYTADGPPTKVGLGLSVVHAVMQAHQGWVTIDSVPNSGTTVSLYFPSLTQPAVEQSISPRIQVEVD